MLNYVAMQIVTFCIVFWENPSGSNTVGIINAATKGGWFPTIFGNAYTLNVIIVLAITLVVYVYMKYSKQGYEISVVGESQNTARYAGIDVKKVIIRTMMISGANLWNCRCSDRQRCEPYHLDKYSRWTGIYGDHCCMDVKFQSACDDPCFRIPCIYAAGIDPGGIAVWSE